MIALGLLRKPDRTAEGVRRKANVGIGEQDPLRRTHCGGLRHSVRLADPALRKLPHMQYRQPARGHRFGGNGIQQLAGAVGRTIIDNDGL